MKRTKLPTLAWLVNQLSDLSNDEDLYKDDVEQMHRVADGLLLEYINDLRVSRIFDEIPRWYGDECE